jgi:thiamine pyrophosphate-dependent acetolactate synthase large subunit-like protein
MEALRKRRDQVRFIQVRHEEAAALMACGYAKFTGGLGTIATWWARHIPVQRGQMHSLSGNLATMAAGLPYAIAALSTNETVVHEISVGAPPRSLGFWVG